MGFKPIVVLVVTIFLAGSFSSTVASKPIESTLPVFVQPLNQKSVEHTRLLRNVKATGNIDEERIMDALTSTIIKFKTWKLGSNIDAALLKTSKLEKLREYVDKFNQGKIPSMQISVVGGLMSKYGDDTVLQALVRAKQIDGAKDAATKLETELFTVWMNNRQFTDSVFMTLKIHNDRSILRQMEKITVLENYIVFLNRKMDKTDNLLNALTRGFTTEEKVFSRVAMAKKDPFTMNRATELETMLLLQKVGNRIALDGGLDKLMRGKNLKIMNRYATTLSKSYVNNDVSLLGALVAKYGDEAIAKALAKAKTVEETKNVATKLQIQQLKKWLKDEKSVDEVFKLLQLDDYDEVLLTSRALDTLQDYITLFNREKQAHESFIKKVSEYFDGDNAFAIKLLGFMGFQSTREKAKELQNQLFQKWKDEGFDSITIINKVFKVPTTEETTDKSILRTAKEFNNFLENSATRVNTVPNVVNPTHP